MFTAKIPATRIGILGTVLKHLLWWAIALSWALAEFPKIHALLSV